MPAWNVARLTLPDLSKGEFESFGFVSMDVEIDNLTREQFLSLVEHVARATGQEIAVTITRGGNEEKLVIPPDDGCPIILRTRDNPYGEGMKIGSLIVRKPCG